jgi:alkanesulfonate monooxygenase SsuD/methylene tetrahydromethanopterin reductase-like flavin-dependent oxidoreductase (luciferase family)
VSIPEEAGMVHFSQLLLCDRREDKTGQERYEQLLEEIRLLESLDYDTAWFAEHHFSGYALIPNTLMMIAAAARETRRIKLGAGVVVLPFHHPVRVVEDAHMVDCLSNGRLILGVGRGYQPLEFEGFGQTVAESPDRYSQALEVTLQLLADPNGSGDYDTPIFKGRGATVWPKPVQRPIPVWGACVSDASFPRYGKLGWPILTFPANQQPADFKRQVAAYRQAYVAAGHDPAEERIAMTMFSYVHPDREFANRTFEAGMTHYFNFLHSITKNAESKQGSFYVEIPTLARLSGTPRDVIERLRELQDQFQVSDFLLNTGFAGYLTQEQTLGSVRLFAEEVFPAFQPAAAAAR